MFHRAGNFPFQFVWVCMCDLVCAKICTPVTIFICSAMRVKIDFFETPALPAPALLPPQKSDPWGTLWINSNDNIKNFFKEFFQNLFKGILKLFSWKIFYKIKVHTCQNSRSRFTSQSINLVQLTSADPLFQFVTAYFNRMTCRRLLCFRYKLRKENPKMAVWLSCSIPPHAHFPSTPFRSFFLTTELTAEQWKITICRRPSPSPPLGKRHQLFGFSRAGPIRTRKSPDGHSHH